MKLVEPGLVTIRSILSRPETEAERTAATE
jgi:hypothetical protein